MQQKKPLIDADGRRSEEASINRSTHAGFVESPDQEATERPSIPEIPLELAPINVHQRFFFESIRPFHPVEKSDFATRPLTTSAPGVWFFVPCNSPKRIS